VAVGVAVAEALEEALGDGEPLEQPAKMPMLRMAKSPIPSVRVCARRATTSPIRFADWLQ
jgi:hypothetical protein